MTMHINRSDRLGGVPIFEVRRIFYNHSSGFGPKTLEWEGLDSQSIRQLTNALVAEGYITHADGVPFTITRRGRALIGASAAKRIKRSTATRALASVLKRVEIANTNHNFLCKVETVVLFGSYLGSAETLGDLDLAIELVNTVDRSLGTDYWAKVFLDHLHMCNRRYTRVGCEFAWAKEEVMLFLKNRKRTISLLPMIDFISMEKDPGFSYRVLTGDPERVAKRLQEGR